MNVQLVIDNVAQAASNGKTYQRIDPVSGKVVTTGAACSVDDARRVAASSQQAFKTWSKVGPTERRRLLLAAADALDGFGTDCCLAVNFECVQLDLEF